MALKIKFKRQTPIPAEYMGGFADRPSMRTSREALEFLRTEKVPRESWPVSGIVALFIEGYETRFRRKVTSMGGNFFAEVVVAVAQLVIRVGAKDASDSVEAVFSDQLKWVTSSHHKFLLNENNYAKFIIPAMAAIDEKRVGRARAAGEQAEFTRDNSGEGCEEIDF